MEAIVPPDPKNRTGQDISMQHFIHRPRFTRSPGAQRARIASATVLAAALAAAFPPVAAQNPPAAEAAARSFDIPAGPLDAALGAFGRAAGILVAADPQLTAGRATGGLRGSHGVESGLQRLLAGTGLEAVRMAEGGYAVRRAATAASGSTSASAQVLPAVTVAAQAEGRGITEGTGAYAARSSNSATRLDLSLRQTPQSVSIITRQQMDDQGLSSVSDVLQQTPGITVNRDNTEGYSFVRVASRWRTSSSTACPVCPARAAMCATTTASLTR